MTERAYLSLGSNIEPERNLPHAARELRQLGRVVASSTVYRNPAVGPTPQPDFLNAAILLETDLAPRALRAELRGVEERLGRIRGTDKYAPRTIDIDLVMFGTLTLQEPGMVIPDPGLLSHAHIAIPVAELAPDHRHPLSGESLGSIAERLRPAATLSPHPDVTLQMRHAAGLPPIESPT